MESLKQHLTKEGEEILEVIEEIKLKLEDARKKFDQATDDTLIDCYIYEMNALYKKYEYFLKMAKEIGLHMDSTQIITAMIFSCLGLMTLIILSKPIKFLLKTIANAAVGCIAIMILQTMGLPIGINYMTVLFTGLLGIPGIAGLLILCVLL